VITRCNNVLPGLNLLRLFTALAAVDFVVRAAFDFRAFVGALPPTDFRAVCFVRAIIVVGRVGVVGW